MTDHYIQDGDDRMSTAQVVELLGLDRRRVERAAAAGKLRVDARLSMFNGARLYRPEDVHRWIAEVDAELAKQGLVRMRKAEAEGWRPQP